MSEPLPPLDQAGIKAGPPPDPALPIAYRPISGWAVAGFGAGGLLALFTIVTTVVAMWQGAPFFLHPGVLFLAVAGVVLSFLGQRHVQNSEGTRAGAKLARLGLWLSLVSGLSYFSYYFVTGLALENQAHAFLMEKTDDDSGFFPRLREGATDPVQLNAAFLLTRLPRQREGIRPENEDSLVKVFDTPNKEGMPGDLTSFRTGTPQSFYNAMPRFFFKQNAKDVKIIELGAQEWKYEQKSYTVIRKYRIETKEVEWEVMLAVCSAEAESAGQGRKWFLNLSQSGIASSHVTEFGKGMRALRAFARADLEQRIARLNAGEALDIGLYDRTEWNKRFADDAPGKRTLVHRLFADKAKDRLAPFKVIAEGTEVGRYEEVEGKIRVYHSFRIAVKDHGKEPPFFLDGYSVQETDRATDPIQIALGMPVPGWNLLQLVFTNISQIPQPKGMMP